MEYLALCCCRAAALLAIFATLSAWPVQANDITTEWATVKPPPVPELKPVDVDTKTTALLILDLMKTNCGVRPRCIATVPNVEKLLDAARGHDMMVFYTLVGQTPALENMVDSGLAPRSMLHIEMVRVQSTDREPANPRLSDGLVDLMKDFSLSSSQGIGGAWKIPPHVSVSGDTFDERYGEW